MPKNWGQDAAAAHVEIGVDEEGSTYLEMWGWKRKNRFQKFLEIIALFRKLEQNPDIQYLI
jgi:hypothetical protein